MARTIMGDASITAIIGEADSCDATAIPEVRVPADKYVIVLSLQTSPSAIVVADSGNLLGSSHLPYEVFPRFSPVSGDETASATPEAIARFGLDGVFEPDPAQRIRVIPISDSISAGGSLVIMGSPAQVPEITREIREERAAELEAFVARTTPVAVRYEWEILRHVSRSPSPVIVTDETRRIVYSNNTLCEMLGRSADEIIGTPLDDLVHFENEPTLEIPYSPECIEVTTPVFIKPLHLVFTSKVSLMQVKTVCGDRVVFVLEDICTDRRASNSNILLIQKLSNIVLSEQPPQTVIRKLINLITLTLSCDLVCILRRRKSDEMIVTPYCNRRPETVRASVIEAGKEPVLQSFFTKGNPVFCDNVGTSCPQPSFFNQVSEIDRFALMPIGDRTSFRYAILAAWSKRHAGLGPESIPLLRIVGNLVGCALAGLKLTTEKEQERDALRRYTRLTAGREIRMADLKRENAQLRELLTKLSMPGKE